VHRGKESAVFTVFTPHKDVIRQTSHQGEECDDNARTARKSSHWIPSDNNEFGSEQGAADNKNTWTW